MRRILIVEAEAGSRARYAREVARWGYTVIPVGDSSEALRRLTADPPDLVILDLPMPGIDGMDLLDRMVARNRSVPIILHTSSFAYQDDFVCWLADDYVVESSDLSGLKRSIQRLLPAPSRQRRSGAKTDQRHQAPAAK